VVAAKRQRQMALVDAARYERGDFLSYVDDWIEILEAGIARLAGFGNRHLDIAEIMNAMAECLKPLPEAGIA
jgi:hypothetical protein